MQVIVKANPDGSFCDLDQVLSRLPYQTSKESLQFSIRALIEKGLIMRVETLVSRRGRARRVIAPTLMGYRATREENRELPVEESAGRNTG